MIRSTTCGLAALAIAAGAQAQTSKLYLSEWQQPLTWIVQGGEIIGKFERADTQDGPGMAIADTIRNIGQNQGTAGHEYALDGSPLGNNYSNPAYTSLYDGTTDGANHNWSIGHNDFPTEFAVVQGDREWGGLSVRFVPQRRSSGIAYDATDQTLWVTNTLGSCDRVQQYDLKGNLVSEFEVSIPGGYAIALDPADDTLWIVESFGAPQIHQYTKSGKFLQAHTLPDMQTCLGAEFAVGAASCYADCDGSGELDVDDFICFQTAFGTGDDYADCDNSGELDIDDFICYQTAYGLGCG